MDFTNIPIELKNNALFCTWRLENNSKRPYNPVYDTYAKSNNQNTFNDWSTIIKYLPKYMQKNKDGAYIGGLGLGIFKGYSAIDIDNCVDDDGKLSDMALNIIDYVKSYTEYSPSGKGIRIIFKTNVLINKDTHYIMNSQRGLEIYISENTNKYVTLTGNIYNDTDYINDIDITYILDKYMLKQKPVIDRVAATPLEINNIDERITSALEINPNFYKAWNRTASGSGGSESEDDLSLLNYLTRIMDGQQEAINQAFMQSPYFLSKDDAHIKKWVERKDYQLDTMRMSINAYHTMKLNQDEFLDLNDTGNARKFADMYDGLVLYNVDNKKWMIWNGEYWQPDMFGQMKLYAEVVIEQMRSEALNLSGEARKKTLSNIQRISNTHGKEAMLKEAQHLNNIPVTNNMFDINPELINTKSGIINLRTGDVTKHDKTQMMSNYINITVSHKEPKVWLKFLNQTYSDNPEIVPYMQRLVGYWMTGLTSEQSMYILLGDGSNGKSLLLDTILKLTGDYGTTSSSELLVDRVFNNTSDQRLATLIGSRFVMVEETEANERLKESTIKNMTSDYGEITARFLYGNEFTYKPVFKLIMATNYKPNIRGTDHGIWRRIKLIPHNNIIPDHKQDKMLGYKLEQELPEILGWAIKGAMEYFANGLQEPDIISKQVQEYRTEMDVVSRWINDNCDISPEFSEKSSLLYNDFVTYCETNKEYVMSNQMFGRNMLKKYDRWRAGDGIYYRGIKLKDRSLLERIADIKINREEI